ncbi:MAG: hypothetical protein FWG98_04085 [Candidatus Cloacimonetes bacterium]|nr:hypothetical protein [Candidatus Cloacimonadota bacterium]
MFKHIMLNKTGLFTYIIYILFFLLYANEPVTYRLINANQLNMNYVNEEYITYLRGNVHFFYADIEFFADMADIYESQQFVILTGNVLIIQDSLSIASDDAQYFHQTEFLQVRGNVIMTETHSEGTFRRATSNSGMHYRDRGEFILQGNVFAHDERESFFGTAGFATFNQETGYGYMIERPVIWRTEPDSLALYAEKIEFFEDTNRMVASFDVITQNSEIVVRSNFLIYYGNEDRMVYIGEPRFFTDSGDGNADLITVFLENSDIREIVMEGECFIEFSSGNNHETESNVKDNWIESDFMNLFYLENKPQEFIASGNVRSFFIQNRQQRSNSMDNNVTGELLNIFFDDDSNVTELRINERVRGKYRFIRN